MPIILSWGFVLLAVMLVAWFFLQVSAYQPIEQPHPGKVDPKGDGGAANRTAVSTSTFSGFDGQQQPFKISAEHAVRDTTDPNFVVLQKVAGTVKRLDGAILSFAGRDGRYDMSTKTLNLTNDVQLVSAGQFVASLSQAEIDVDNQGLVSHSPVVVKMDNGEITAAAMTITDEGTRVLFTGQVKARFGDDSGKADMR